MNIGSADRDGLLAEMLGEEYVKRRKAARSDFNAPYQDFVDQNCFGDIWQRAGLDRRTRSLVLIGMLVALNRMDQAGWHVRSAIQNGATVQEVQEVLLTLMLYAGLPAAADGFRVAEAVLKEVGAL